jgi:hypothetical protein
MTDPRKDLSESEGEDWLDALLIRDARETPSVDDGGFTARVLTALPARRRAAVWIVPASAVLASVLGFYVLGGAEYFFDALLDLFTERKFGGMQVSVLGTLLVLYACAAAGAWSER